MQAKGLMPAPPFSDRVQLKKLCGELLKNMFQESDSVEHLPHVKENLYS